MALFYCVFTLTLFGCATALSRILYRRHTVDYSVSASPACATRRTLLSPQLQHHFAQVIKACRCLNEPDLASALLFVHVPLQAVVNHAPESMVHQTLDIVLTNAHFTPVIAFINDQTPPDTHTILKQAGILAVLLSDNLSNQHMQQYIKDTLLQSTVQPSS